MLGSITPLGERGRGSRWGVTVSAYLVGSAAGGAALGATLGTLGQPLPLSSTARLLILAGAVVIGIAFVPIIPTSDSTSYHRSSQRSGCTRRPRDAARSELVVGVT